GQDRGPLHGIPIVHKDIYDTAGTLTTIGSEFFQSRIPEQDATTVRQMREAGTVLLGKTNMNEFAAGISGTNAFYGDAHNPWKLDYSPGGSSSGTGAAIASGLCLGGTGTDTGGSIRVPASWCGISGIRPTYGLVSLAGIYPRAYSLDVAGPLAKTVGDVALLLDAMSGYDPRDANSSLSQRRTSYADGLDQGIEGMRIGIIDNYTYRDVDPEVAAAIQAAVETFSSLGAEIVAIDIPLLSSGPLEYSALFNILLYEFNQILGEAYNAEPNKNLFGPTVQGNIATGSEITAETYETAQKERPGQIAELKAAFNRVDALITPALPMVAPLLNAEGEIYARGRQFTLPFSFTALPSITTPCGFSSDGLPIGMQIVGNHFEEALILRIAAAFESSTPFSKERPPIYCDKIMSQ
ncbi:MAG: amidase, partial [Phormidesmis sp.]